MPFQRLTRMAAFWTVVLLPGLAWADPPLDRISLPDGFKIDVWAEVDGARSLELGDGFVIVGTQGSAVYAVPYDPETMEAGQVVTITNDLSVANGVTLLDGVLYIAEQPRVVRWGDQPFDINNPVQTPVQIGPNLKDNPWHGWRYMTAGPDGRLYIALGTACNICMPDGDEGRIIRMNMDGTGVEDVATGVRNSVGMAFHPVNGDLYFTDNGADMMGDNTPPEELNRVREIGQNYGYPWFGGGRARTAEFKDEALPDDLQFPIAQFPAHTAGLGIAFYGGDMFPADYKGDLFLAQRGSWNRTIPIGYQLVRVMMDDNGNVQGQEVFAKGWLRRGRAWGRPVDVKQLPDGSLLLSDNEQNVIYRITYEGS